MLERKKEEDDRREKGKKAPLKYSTVSVLKRIFHDVC